MKFAISASNSPEAQAAAKALNKKYNVVESVSDADALIALGGDGQLLTALHSQLGRDVPVFGMNCGSVGFLMNNFEEDDLEKRIKEARHVPIYPLKMEATTYDGETVIEYAINEVSLWRNTYQAAKIKISVNDVVRVEELICDGALVATAVGSTAYNLSAHGPILPLRSQSLALTPISAFRPRRWRGAILKQSDRVLFEVIEGEKRPVTASADSHVANNVKTVAVEEDQGKTVNMLFDPHYSLEERIIKEQFES